MRATLATPSNGKPSRILVAEDDELVRLLLEEVLSEEGYSVTCAPDGKVAVSHFERETFDLVITDLVMPGLNGVEVLRKCKQIDPTCRVIVVTGYPSVENVVRLIDLGAADYITKPFNVDLIRVTVAKMLALRRVSQDAPAESLTPSGPALDAETHIYNMALFGELLDVELQRSELRGHLCSLMTLALRAPRATQGQSDEIARQFVQVLRVVARPGDMIGRVARWGFAVLLPETARGQANALARRVMKAATGVCKAGVGVACFPLDATTPEGLMRASAASLDLTQENN